MEEALEGPAKDGQLISSIRTVVKDRKRLKTGIQMLVNRIALLRQEEDAVNRNTRDARKKAARMLMIRQEQAFWQEQVRTQPDIDRQKVSIMEHKELSEKLKRTEVMHFKEKLREGLRGSMSGMLMRNSVQAEKIRTEQQRLLAKVRKSEERVLKAKKDSVQLQSCAKTANGTKMGKTTRKMVMQEEKLKEREGEKLRELSELEQVMILRAKQTLAEHEKELEKLRAAVAQRPKNIGKYRLKLKELRETHQFSPKASKLFSSVRSFCTPTIEFN